MSSVRSTLGRVDGVKSVEVDFNQKTAKVTVDKSKKDTSKLLKALDDTNKYKGEIVQ